MTIYSWNLPTPFDGGTWADNPSASGGEAQNGMEQNVFNMSMKLRSRWTVAIRSTDDVLAARAFQARMAGKSNLCLVPLFDGKRVSWPVAFGIKQTPTRTRLRSLIGTIFEQPAIPDESDVYGHADGTYGYGATTILVHMGQGGPPRAGQWFCLQGSRAHLIASVTGPVSSNYTLHFIPPLRSPVVDEQLVEFAKLYCLMNQTRSDQGIQMLDGVATAVLDMEFVEGFEDDALQSGS